MRNERVMPLKDARRTPSNPKAGGERKFRFSPDKDQVSCAGQGCKDSMKCQRYRRHAAWRDQQWASFDIERQKVDPRFCPVFEPIQ